MRLNTIPEIRERAATGQVTWIWPVLMLVSRLALFALWQALFAVVLAGLGSANPWEASIAWWPFGVILTNLVSLLLLDALARREGMRYRDYLNFEPGSFWRDLLLALGVLIVSAPLAFIPNIALATALFGDPQQALNLMFRPLPGAAAWVAFLLFPLTIALAELPTYYAFAMPRLAVLARSGVTAILLASFFLSIQHATLPLIFDWRFLVWRGLMFWPFALVLAIALYWRPRLLAYLMVGHFLIDLLAAWSIVAASLR